MLTVQFIHLNMTRGLNKKLSMILIPVYKSLRFSRDISCVRLTALSVVSWQLRHAISYSSKRGIVLSSTPLAFPTNKPENHIRSPEVSALVKFLKELSATNVASVSPLLQSPLPWCTVTSISILYLRKNQIF